MASERYFIGPGLKDKLREIIYRVDEMPRVESGVTVPTVEQSMHRNPPQFRICTFTGSWAIGSDKTITFKSDTARTAVAKNLFWPVPDGPTRDCAVAREGTAWYLVTPQLYSANAATSATLTSSALEFSTLPVVALATASTVTFSVTPKTIMPVTGVTLGTSSLVFARVSAGVFFEQPASPLSISVSTCATSQSTP